MLKNHRRRVLLALLFASSFHPALPALAQSTLVGYWEPLYFEDSEERIRGPEIGDYTGLPISDAARMRADTWEPDLPTMPERQCIPHPSTYGFRGIGTLRIWETRDAETQELLRIDTLITWQSQHRILAIFGGNVVFDDPRGPQGAIALAHENVGLRLAMAHQGHSEAAQPLWPTDAFAGDSYDLFFNDEPVRLLHVAGAHTDGDVLVFFRRSDVLATGDVFSTVSYPVIDVRHGGTIDGEISALNRIIEIAIPRDKEEGGTIIVPGHGRLCDEADVVEYRDMVTIIRDRIRDMMSRGLSLERIQSLKPTYDYDARYGSTAGPWTTRDFVESIYRTLKPSLRGTQP